MDTDGLCDGLSDGLCDGLSEGLSEASLMATNEHLMASVMASDRL
jgi:hypothetical protein